MNQTTHRTVVAALVSAALAASCVDFVGPDTTPAATQPETKPGVGGTSAPETSILRIIAATTGTDLDPDGYVVRLDPQPDDATSAVVFTNGSLDVRLPAGSYVVSLEGVAPNCSVAGHGWYGTASQIVLPRGSTKEPAVQVSFSIQCDAIPTSRLDDGTQLAFVRDGQIWLVNSYGSDQVKLTAGPDDSDPAWSHDGTRIAFARRGAIYVMDADGSNVIRLTSGLSARHPTWSPDGRRIAFASFCPQPMGTDACVLIASTDPADTTHMRVGWPRGWHDSPAWSPDGTRIAFASDWNAFDFVADIYVESLTDGRITPLTHGMVTFWNEEPTPTFQQPAWSPDGQQLAAIVCPTAYYNCDSSYLLVMDANGMRQLPAQRAGTPTWSPDGRTIAFSAGALTSATAGSIQWIRVDGTERGIIVADGHSPAWRPSR